jgi:hypothetical protein
MVEEGAMLEILLDLIKLVLFLIVVTIAVVSAGLASVYFTKGWEGLVGLFRFLKLF